MKPLKMVKHQHPDILHVNRYVPTAHSAKNTTARRRCPGPFRDPRIFAVVCCPAGASLPWRSFPLLVIGSIVRDCFRNFLPQICPGFMLNTRLSVGDPYENPHSWDINDRVRFERKTQTANLSCKLAVCYHTISNSKNGRGPTCVKSMRRVT